VKNKRTWAMISCMLMLITCTKDQGGPGGCFQQEVLPIFVSNCTMAGCHNSKDKKSGYDLSNYEGIMKGIKAKHPLRSEIYNTIKGKNPSMPEKPYPKLSATDVNMIKHWINMGASNSSNCKACDTTTTGYNARIKGTMQTWCVGCHNNGNSGGGIDLSDYKALVKAIPGNRLLGSIKHLPGFSAMPQNGAQLPTCEITAIEIWIKNGYPEN